MTEILVGFLIAAGVGLTGVGAGSLLAPVLMLFFKIPPAEAVGTALAFSAIIKLTIAPVYVVRKQIHYPTLLRLCCGAASRKWSRLPRSRRAARASVTGRRAPRMALFAHPDLGGR